MTKRVSEGLGFAINLDSLLDLQPPAEPEDGFENHTRVEKDEFRTPAPATGPTTKNCPNTSSGTPACV